jgi:hypothetical protein
MKDQLSKKGLLDSNYESVKKRYEELAIKIPDLEKFILMPSKRQIIQKMTDALSALEFDKDYYEFRNAILSMHWVIDILMNRLIASSYLPDANATKVKSFTAEIVFEIPFAKKVKIIQGIGITRKIAGKILAINDLRIAFAHAFKKSHTQYFYKKKRSIFKDETLEIVWRDFESFIFEIDPLLKKHSIK